MQGSHEIHLPYPIYNPTELVKHNLIISYPLLEFETIKDELQRDKNVIRKNFIGVDTTNAARDHLPVQCTLRDELKPPTERPSIKHMMDLGRTRPRFKKFWDPKTGMDFYPFHR